MESESACLRVRELLILGDNRLKQGVAAGERALALARQAGLEEWARPLVEGRLAELDRLERESR